MIGVRKQRTYLFMTAILVAGAFFSHTRVFASEYSDYIKDISSEFNMDLKNADIDHAVPKVIEKYCSTVLSKYSSFVDNGYSYDARQSAFVYLLCKTVGKEGWSSIKPEYFSLSDFSVLGLQDIPDENYPIDYCSSMDNDCNLSSKLPELFNMIVSDYVNMKQANIYGLVWNFSTEEDMEAQINIFSLAHFNIKLCEKEERTYDATCRAMKWYLKNARNLLSDVRVFNISDILAVVKPRVQLNAKNVFEIPYSKTSILPAGSLKDCASDKGTMDSDIFLCWLYGDTATSIDSFTNLLYNELFFYRLFMADYLLNLQKHTSILSQNTYVKNYSTISKNFNSQYNRSKEALSLTLRMMRDTYTAYPLHIGFLMYQEDLKGFGRLLSKIATPIYTLYDKLRNVQKPK